MVGSSTEVLALLRESDMTNTLKKGFSVLDIMRVKDDYGLTGLHHACMRGNIQVGTYWQRRYIQRVQKKRPLRIFRKVWMIFSKAVFEF